MKQRRLPPVIETIMLFEQVMVDQISRKNVFINQLDAFCVRRFVKNAAPEAPASLEFPCAAMIRSTEGEGNYELVLTVEQFNEQRPEPVRLMDYKFSSGILTPLTYGTAVIPLTFAISCNSTFILSVSFEGKILKTLRAPAEYKTISSS